jgi:hypothetical protein
MELLRLHSSPALYSRLGIWYVIRQSHRLRRVAKCRRSLGKCTGEAEAMLFPRLLLHFPVGFLFLPLNTVQCCCFRLTNSAFSFGRGAASNLFCFTLLYKAVDSCLTLVSKLLPTPRHAYDAPAAPTSASPQVRRTHAEAEGHCSRTTRRAKIRCVRVRVDVYHLLHLRRGWRHSFQGGEGCAVDARLCCGCTVVLWMQGCAVDARLCCGCKVVLWT